MLHCLVPSWPQSMQLRISFRSRSDLVPDHALEFPSYLVFQACLSFCSVLDTSGASMFSPCSHKSAVAHVIREFLQRERHMVPFNRRKQSQSLAFSTRTTQSQPTSVGTTLNNRAIVGRGRNPPKKPPTQIKTQFAQTISGQFVQTVPRFSF